MFVELVTAREDAGKVSAPVEAALSQLGDMYTVYLPVFLLQI